MNSFFKKYPIVMGLILGGLILTFHGVLAQTLPTALGAVMPQPPEGAIVTPTTPPQTPAASATPMISNVVPATIAPDKDTALTILGSNFNPSSQVIINGTILPIDPIPSTPTALSVTIPQGSASSGIANIKVINPDQKDNLGVSNGALIKTTGKTNNGDFSQNTYQGAVIENLNPLTNYQNVGGTVAGGFGSGSTTVASAKKCYRCLYQEFSECFIQDPKQDTKENCGKIMSKGYALSQCDWNSETGHCMSRFENNCLVKAKNYQGFEWNQIYNIKDADPFPADCTVKIEDQESHSDAENCNPYLDKVSACIQGLPEGGTGTFVHNGCSTFENENAATFYIENNIAPHVPPGCTVSISGNQTTASKKCSSQITITFTCNGITNVAYGKCHKEPNNLCYKGNLSTAKCTADDGSIQKETCCLTYDKYSDTNTYIAKWTPGETCQIEPSATNALCGNNNTCLSFPGSNDNCAIGSACTPKNQSSAPKISSVVPSTINSKNPSTITIVGKGFSANSKVVINGKVLSINQAQSSPQALSVDLPASLSATNQNLDIKVLNPELGGAQGFSNLKTISVSSNQPTTAENLIPVIAVGTIIETSQPLNLRTDHTPTSTILSSLPAGTTATVTGGPIFASGYKWWQVNPGSIQSGWLAEFAVDISNNASGNTFFTAAPKPKPGLNSKNNPLGDCNCQCYRFNGTDKLCKEPWVNDECNDSVFKYPDKVTKETCFANGVKGGATGGVTGTKCIGYEKKTNKLANTGKYALCEFSPSVSNPPNPIPTPNPTPVPTPTTTTATPLPCSEYKDPSGIMLTQCTPNDGSCKTKLKGSYLDAYTCSPQGSTIRFCCLYKP